VRERLILDLIAFRFHAAGQPVRDYVDQFFQAANFLQYEATEQQLVAPRGPSGRETGLGPGGIRPPGQVFEQFIGG